MKLCIGRARRRARRGASSGFTLIELLVAIGLTAVLGAVVTLAMRGFDGVGTASRCRADTTRLRKAETAYFLAHDAYGDEPALVASGLLSLPSELHDVSMIGGAYAITEVGPCIGQSSAYGIAAPTVGVAAHSGTTVSVLAPDGTGVAGVAASYARSGDSTWTVIGTTDGTGSVHGALADGVYDLRVSYDGTLNTLSQVTVTSGTVVTFPAVVLTVRLRDPFGSGLAGGAVSLQAAGGSPVALGTTPTSGDLVANVLPGSYDVTLTYGSMTSARRGVAVAGATVVAFQTCAAVVQLRAVNGSALAGGVVTAAPSGGGAPLALGTTDASGDVQVVLLGGSYDVAMRYGGATSVQSVTIGAGTTVTFRLVTVTVHLAQSTGTPLTGSDAGSWYRPSGSAIWVSLGAPNGSGNATVDLLPSDYDFEASWFSISSVRAAVTIAGTSTVTFQTTGVVLRMQSSAGAPLSGQDSALYVRITGQQGWVSVGVPDVTGSLVAELFPGTYDFEARWYGITSAQTGVTVGAAATVTFRTTALSCRLLTANGNALSGQDAACFFRVSGTTPWNLAGYPDASGTVVQELFAATYDVDMRWIGVHSMQPAIPVVAGNPGTVTFRTKTVALRMLASTGAGLSGQDGALWVRPIGTTPWTMVGVPDATGTWQQELLPATYDVQARWFGAYVVQGGVGVSGPTTVTFQTTLATLRMQSSTGSGLAGQDESFWVRQTGTSAWFQTDTPVNGVVAQELFPTTYDVRSRWFGVYAQRSAVNVNAPTSVTFSSVPVTLRMLTSTGSGLTGQDEAMWVRQTGASSYFFLGAPPANGVIVQELYSATYDVKFRWVGAVTTFGSNAVSGPTTVTASAAAVAETCRRHSDGTPVVGATGSVVNAGVTYSLGTSDAAGLVNLQVFPGSYNFRCKLGTLVGTNLSVNVGAGGAATTVDMT